ncbi:FadR/GntR family transcriptional regulator [Georgenia yuyongxinii]|uniref:FadR family transcriptional regulator n=1 Tax=Georgenia yuyongxinii TaxID=2589797 RepID=A0A552WNS9_9MICO|nr:FCD domain-containing protein [Georgenia yuyongxinii]TRW44249.1 FadR family transcriptional regulator [Georgenia yuyongxinii]
MSQAVPPLRAAPQVPERTSRAQAVADQLSALIVGNAVRPGDRLGTKEELRHRFGVAAGTLNEAVRLLETRGLVDARPGPRGGIFVAQPSAHIRLSHLILGLGADAMSVADSLEIRSALEVPIAAQAARHITRAQVAELEKIVEEMGELRDRPAEYLRRNWDLHGAIAAASANQLLRTIYVSLLDTAREAVRDIAPDRDFVANFPQNLALHRELVAAVASGEVSRARRAAEAHNAVTADAAAQA